jgi:hypothetical protein
VAQGPVAKTSARQPAAEPAAEPAEIPVEPPLAEEPAGQAPAASHHTLTLQGKVGWLADSLQQRFGIRTVPEARERVLCLETDAAKIYPLVEDLRGRSFRSDKRLRDLPVELIVRRHEGAPVVQVIRIYEIRGKEKYELDYWCDVCAIAMYETGPCECCQDHNRLRKRLVDERGAPVEP